MTDLAGFLESRIGEDDEYCDGANEYSNCDELSTRRRHDAEVKRAIIERWRHLQWQLGEIHKDPSLRGGLQSVLSSMLTIELIMKRFALAYEEHPDFRDEWRLPSPDFW